MVIQTREYSNLKKFMKSFFCHQIHPDLAKNPSYIISYIILKSTKFLFHNYMTPSYRGFWITDKIFWNNYSTRECLIPPHPKIDIFLHSFHCIPPQIIGFSVSLGSILDLPLLKPSYYAWDILKFDASLQTF